MATITLITSVNTDSDSVVNDQFNNITVFVRMCFVVVMPRDASMH